MEARPLRTEADFRKAAERLGRRLCARLNRRMSLTWRDVVPFLSSDLEYLSNLYGGGFWIRPVDRAKVIRKILQARTNITLV